MHNHPPAKGLLRFLVPEEEAHAARLELSALAQRGPVPPADAAWLCHAENGMELLAIEALLGDARIRCFRREALVNHGIDPGESGPLSLFVAPADLTAAHTALDALEKNSLDEQESLEVPSDESLENEMIVENNNSQADPRTGGGGLPWVAVVMGGLIVLILIWFFSRNP